MGRSLSTPSVLNPPLATLLAASTGSSLVGFQQSGTGSVAQILPDILRDRISLSSFVTVGADVTTVDCTPFLHAAIAAHPGKVIEIPYALVNFTTPFIHNTTGLGVVEAPKIIGLKGKRGCELRNSTGATLLTFTSGSASTDFMYGLRLDGFRITNPTVAAGAKGVLLKGVFKSRLNIRVTGQGSHGIHLLSSIGDAEDCSQIDLRGCETEGNGGDGIRAEGITGGIHSQIWADETRNIGNTGLGVSFKSVIQGTLRRAALAYNLGGGFFGGANAGQAYCKNLVVEDNEFDSNQGVQVDFELVAGASERRNQYISNPGAPTVTTQLRVRAAAIGVSSEQAHPRIDPTLTGITMFDVAVAATGIRIEKTLWNSWIDTGNTRYVNNARNVVQNLDESYAITVSSYSNLNSTPVLDIGRRTRVGNRVFVDVQMTLDVTATGPLNITFNTPMDMAQSTSAVTGTAVEINSITQGMIFDATSGSSNAIVMWFISIPVGARTVRTSFSYSVAD